VTTEENLEFLESFMKETFTVTIGFAQISNQKFSPHRICRMFVKGCFGVSGAFYGKHIISRKRTYAQRPSCCLLDEKTVLSKNILFFSLSFPFLS
jgi:hypothetical protein